MDNIVQFCMVLTHHLVVDEITRRVGPGDIAMTTVRGKTADGKSTNESKAPRQILLFYAFYQFCALGSHLVPSARLSDLGYNALVAIQSSAFLMTLFRKGLIRWYTHAFWYTVALIMSHAVMVMSLSSYWFYLKVGFMFNLRVNFGMNKYAIWLIFAIISTPVVEQMIFSKFDAMTSSAMESEYLHGLKLDMPSMETFQNISVPGF